jgi:hypothetical protein
MSLHSFTVLALSLRKRTDLDLRPARIHSLLRPRSFASHIIAQEQNFTVSAARQRCGRVRFTHSPLVHAAWKARENRRLRCVVCESGVSLCRHPRTSVCVKRHLSRIFPCLTRSLASVLIPRPAAAARLCFALRAPLRVSAFRKSFRQTSAQNADEKIFRTFRKSAAWPWERGTLASLRARVSRVRTGQIQTGEKQWHSTPTP